MCVSNDDVGAAAVAFPTRQWMMMMFMLMLMCTRAQANGFNGKQNNFQLKSIIKT